MEIQEVVDLDLHEFVAWLNEDGSHWDEVHKWIESVTKIVSILASFWGSDIGTEEKAG